MPRRDVFSNDGKVALQMPKCEAYYLITYFFEIGPTLISGGAESPISQSEIAHWQSNTGIELSSWEARNLRNLSMIYITESFKAKKPDYPAPWKDADYVVNSPSRKMQRTKNAMKALMSL